VRDISRRPILLNSLCRSDLTRDDSKSDGNNYCSFFFFVNSWSSCSTSINHFMAQNANAVNQSVEILTESFPSPFICSTIVQMCARESSHAWLSILVAQINLLERAISFASSFGKSVYGALLFRIDVFTTIINEFNQHWRTQRPILLLTDFLFFWLSDHSFFRCTYDESIDWWFFLLFHGTSTIMS